MAVNMNIGSSSEEEKIEKSYFDVLGLCCSSEAALVERILYSHKGVKHVSVVIPSKTVIVVHDSLLITPFQIAKALNQAKLEANVRMNSSVVSHRKRWPSPYVIFCGALLALSFFKYLYAPLQWIAVGAVAVGVWPIAMRAFAAVRNFTLDVNILVLIAVMGTLALKDFLEAGTIVFLFTIAEWLQSRASHKATAVMTSLMSIAPHKATVAETGQVVDVQDVKLNTVLAVKAGEAIPIDGIVVEGTCEVDQKALTGESFPVEKQKDSIVWAGTINLNGYICVKTTALADECVVAKMAKLVEEAQSKRPKIQRLIDTCAKYYTPAVVLVSALLAAVPAAITMTSPHSTRVVELDKNHWFHLALVVLVGACPCGLVLSTPVATFCALSRAATTGLLIKGGDHIETLATVKVVAFDKTGTITRGDFVVTAFRSEETSCTVHDLLFWVSSLESKSSHPIADALVGFGRSHSVEPKPDLVQDFHVFPGEGISGKIDGREIYVGNRKFALRAGCASAPEIQSGGHDQDDIKTLGLVYSNGAVIGTFNLSDTCRSGAADAVKQLKSMGITTALLTGDANSAAMHAQHQLGNALDAIYAELLPEDKARIIKDYKKSVGPTSMVGDGVNDAPALVTADVGISMGVSGSPLATETGHVILMSNDITKIPKAIKLAKKTRRKVIENIVFSITTKVAVLAVAIAGHPIVWLAVLVDVLTCLLVIINSMLLLRHGQPSFKSHANDHHHHKGNCHSHKLSSSICHDDRKKKIMCQQGSLLKLHHHHHHHHHHGHDHHKNRTYTGSDDNRGSCYVKSDLVAEKIDPAKCSFPGSLIPKQHANRDCSSHGCKSSRTCCDSVTHNHQDLCENEVDGSQDRCHLSASTPRETCQKEECRDLEAQDGCLRGDDCGLMEGRSHQLICCSGHAHAHVEEEEVEVNQADTKGNVVVEVGCRDGALTLPISKECQHCTGVGRVDVPSAANNSYACYIDAVGRGEIGGCCRSFRKECCQIHDHMRASLVAGFGGRASLTEITTE